MGGTALKANHDANKQIKEATEPYKFKVKEGETYVFRMTSPYHSMPTDTVIVVSIKKNIVDYSPISDTKSIGSMEELSFRHQYRPLNND